MSFRGGATKSSAQPVLSHRHVRDMRSRIRRKRSVEGDRDQFAPEGRNSFSTSMGGISMTKLYAYARKFVRDEEGASLAEYGLLLALIAVVCLAGMTTLGTKINSMFNQVASTI